MEITATVRLPVDVDTDEYLLELATTLTGILQVSLEVLEGVGLTRAATSDQEVIHLHLKAELDEDFAQVLQDALKRVLQMEFLVTFRGVRDRDTPDVPVPVLQTAYERNVSHFVIDRLNDQYAQGKREHPAIRSWFQPS